jgi:aminopeptidase
MIMDHSLRLVNGKRVLIEAVDVSASVVQAFMQAASSRGVTPHVWLKSEAVMRELAMTSSIEDIQLRARFELDQLQHMDAMILLRSPVDSSGMCKVPLHKLKAVLEHHVKPVHYEYRKDNLKFVTLRWPSPAMAKRAKLDLDSFMEFFFASCAIDYDALSRDVEPLAELMEQTKEVRVVGPGVTDLSFSIAGMIVARDVGHINMPDGEVSTAPVLNSVNGTIQFNVPAQFYGEEMTHITLTYRNGKVVDMISDNQQGLEKLLNQDEGALFVGEFALGVNSHIHRPIGDILFDEKMAGSLHLAQGDSYGPWDNGNRSCVHMDFILDQRESYGGGELYFDDQLIRKNGKFLKSELSRLNPV